MSKKGIVRCPLQTECERKCTFEGHELDCDYYKNNAREDLVIADQEAIRERQIREREEQMYEELLNEEPDEDEADDDNEPGPSIPVKEQVTNIGNMVMIPLDLLYPHPDNPRKDLGDLTELSDSIRENGVFQNLTVVPGHYISEENRHYLDTGYTIIIGHRRTAAAKIAGLYELPCIIVEMSKEEQIQTMLLENMQRSDLTVFEQAQGFQMMIDMGQSTEEISQKTGFSKRTIKRRLKMAELDQATLRDVSSRQISLDDFDTLAKIEDLSVRNECLKTIGTPNFDMEVQKRIKTQNIAKNLPLVQSEIRRLKGKKLTQSQTWYGDYNRIGDEIQIDKYQPGDINIPDTEEKKLFYYMNEDRGTLQFYFEREKPAPVRRPQEEIDREKAMNEANAKLTELSDLCYQLRSQFVNGLTLTLKNKLDILDGAVSAIIRLGYQYGSIGSDKLCKIVGEERKYENGEEKRITDMLKKDPVRTYPRIVYLAFCDSPTETYHTTYKKQWPRHNDNSRLDAIYSWLTSLGYVMSDDEIALQQGSHELLHLGESEDNNDGQTEES